jgi:hypothetical protein
MAETRVRIPVAVLDAPRVYGVFRVLGAVGEWLGECPAPVPACRARDERVGMRSCEELSSPQKTPSRSSRRQRMAGANAWAAALSGSLVLARAPVRVPTRPSTVGTPAGAVMLTCSTGWCSLGPRRTVPSSCDASVALAGIRAKRRFAGLRAQVAAVGLPYSMNGSPSSRDGRPDHIRGSGTDSARATRATNFAGNEPARWSSGAGCYPSAAIAHRVVPRTGWPENTRAVGTSRGRYALKHPQF